MATVHNGQKKWSQRPNKMVTTATLHWSQRPQIGHNGHIVLVTTATQHWSQGPHSIGQHWSQGPHIIVQYWSQGPHSIGHKGHIALVTRATRNWSQRQHIILCITRDSRDSYLCMYYVYILLSLCICPSISPLVSLPLYTLLFKWILVTLGVRYLEIYLGLGRMPDDGLMWRRYIEVIYYK